MLRGREVVWAVWPFRGSLSLSIKGPAVSEVPRSRAEANNLMAEYIEHYTSSTSGASQGFWAQTFIHPEPWKVGVQGFRVLTQGLRVLSRVQGFDGKCLRL